MGGKHFILIISLVYTGAHYGLLVCTIRLAYCDFAGFFFFCTVYLFIIWLNWSRVKTNILTGSLSGPKFAIRTAKMDRSRSDFTDLCS